MRTYSIALALVVIGVAVPRAAADEPTKEKLREAVGRSLPFLEKEGVAWMRVRECMSCHQAPGMVWSLNLAKKHDFPVDADKLATWNEWLVNNALQKSVYYKLGDKSFTELQKAGLADADAAKLQPLKNKSFAIPGDFHDETVRLLSAETEAKHHDAIIKSAGQPGQGAKGGEVNNQYSATLFAIAPYAAPSIEVRAALVNGLVKSQKKDGSWAPSGQYIAQRRPGTEATEAVTLAAVLALKSVENLPELAVQAGVRAREFLKSAKPGVSTDSVVLHALLAHADGNAERGEELFQVLLKQQHEDGGWGWLRDEPKSDAFATGEVMHALRTLDRAKSAAALSKAQQYLLQSQRPDGSWFQSHLVASGNQRPENKDGDAIYTYWATVWAVIGLLDTLPE